MVSRDGFGRLVPRQHAHGLNLVYLCIKLNITAQSDPAILMNCTEMYATRILPPRRGVIIKGSMIFIAKTSDTCLVRDKEDAYCVRVYSFTTTDRVSTIPSNICGCQSGTVLLFCLLETNCHRLDAEKFPILIIGCAINIIN